MSIPKPFLTKSGTVIGRISELRLRSFQSFSSSWRSRRFQQSLRAALHRCVRRRRRRRIAGGHPTDPFFQCSGTKDRERRSHPHPADGRQALPLHPPRRDSRHAHANAHARIRPHRHLRTPTVLRGPWSMPRGPPAASPPTATKGTPPAPTGHGSTASTHAPQAHLVLVTAPKVGGAGLLQSVSTRHRHPNLFRSVGPAPDALRPTKSQPFSIIWEDNTDSVVDLRTLRQIMRNHDTHTRAHTPPPPQHGCKLTVSQLSKSRSDRHTRLSITVRYGSEGLQGLGVCLR